MLIAQRPSLTEDQVDDFRSRFVIEPLEPGFGYTIGNSVRRTLLSSHSNPIGSTRSIATPMQAPRRITAPTLPAISGSNRHSRMACG